MLETLRSGGLVMIPIALCSVVALAVFFERLWALRGARVVPPDFVLVVRERLRTGQLEDAQALATQERSAAGRVVAAALSVAGAPRADIKERVEELGRQEAADLERGVAVVGTVASISPLLGLLGTVGGMIETFQVIQTAGMGDVANLAGGISVALITTFAGLSVGIPAVVANRYLLSRVDARVLELETLAIEVLDHLSAEAIAADEGIA